MIKLKFEGQIVFPTNDDLISTIQEFMEDNTDIALEFEDWEDDSFWTKTRLNRFMKNECFLDFIAHAAFDEECKRSMIEE